MAAPTDRHKTDNRGAFSNLVAYRHLYIISVLHIIVWTAVNIVLCNDIHISLVNQNMWA